MGPRDEHLVRKAEEILGLRYPPIYRRFLLEFGAGGFFSFEVYGITTDAISNGVWYALQLRERFNLPKDLVPVYDDGIGYKFMIDMRTQQAEPFPIIAYQAGIAEDEQRPETIADDFGIFFLNMVTKRIDYYHSDDWEDF